MNELSTTIPGSVEVLRREPTMLEMIHKTITSGEVRPENLPTVLTAFFEFQQKINAAEAEKAFNRAFAQALLEMPKVVKRGVKDMGGKGAIPYETYEDLDAAIRPIEARHGFARSFSTRSEQGKTGVLLTLRLTHAEGHCITSERYCPPDPGPGRNETQAIGSGESYGRRYLSKSIWNIVTVGSDDDANSADPISEDQAMQIRDILDTLAMEPGNMKRFWAWAEATRPEDIQKCNYERIKTELTKRLKAGGR